MRDDRSGHGVKGGANVCTPSACKTLWPFRRHDDPLLGAGQVESQALGFGDGVGRNPREKFELRIKLGHIDRDGGGVRLGDLSLKLGAVTV